jgi:hypothetical protein
MASRTASANDGPPPRPGIAGRSTGRRGQERPDDPRHDDGSCGLAEAPPTHRHRPVMSDAVLPPLDTSPLKIVPKTSGIQPGLINAPVGDSCRTQPNDHE